MAAGEGQLQRIIRDLQDAVAELTKEYRESGEPITDDSTHLHKFSYKLEYLLQFDQKEKTTFLGTRKDYWDYFSDCLAKIKGSNDGIRFVKSIPELKTSLGKGRAFIRYSLVHQRLADTLQQCLLNQRVTSDWYYARSPFLKPHLSADIISHLYELNEVQFDVASRGHDLDSEWPTFARRTLGGGSPAHLWKPPSRSSSISSLASAFSQAPEFPCSPDFGLLEESSEQFEPTRANGNVSVSEAGGGAVEALRLELDQSELRQRELTERVQQMAGEEAELRQVVEQLQAQLDITLSAHEALQRDSTNQRQQLEREAESLKAESQAREAESRELRVKLEGAEQRNSELLSRLQGEISEKGQQTASYFDSAQKIHALLEQLKEAQKESEQQKAELVRVESALRESEARLEAQDRRAEEEKEELRRLHTEQLEALESRARDLDEHRRDLEQEAGLRAGLEAELREQQKKAEEYRTQCGSLMEVNGTLLQTAKRNEEAGAGLRQRAEELERERAELQEREEELQRENQNLREEQAKVKEALSSMQAELRSIGSQISQLETSLAASRRREEELQQQLREREEERAELLEREQAELWKHQKEAEVLQQERAGLKKERNDRTELHEKERAEWEKERAELHKEAKEKAELHEKERVELQMEVKKKAELRDNEWAEWEMERAELQRQEREAGDRLSSAEAQIALHLGEVSRLQQEVGGLKKELVRATEEQEQARRQVEAVQAEGDELRSLQESLKSQLEQMNREHVRELHNSQEEAQRELREELTALKRQQEALVLELADAREGLHRVNTETAELGVSVCTLTAEKEEAQRELANAESRLKEVQGEGRDLRDQLERAEGHARNLQESHAEELAASRFQMSSEAMSYQNQIKGASEELVTVRSQLTAEQEQVRLLVARLSELEAANQRTFQLAEEKESGIVERESVIGQKDEEMQQLRESLARREADLLCAQGRCKDLQDELEATVAERESNAIKMAAELDDLSRTKSTLEERLIELIRDKDALWQKSDALEFEQKLRAGEQWWLVDKEATHCLDCRSQFTWLLRRHHCRLCGHIFCYYCSNNYVMTRQGGRKERCCRDCYSQHSAVLERLTQAELGNTAPPPGTGPAPDSAPGPAPYTPTPRVTVTDSTPRPDDAVFDIITEEEVNGVYDSDSLSHTTAEDSPERESETEPPQASAELDSGVSRGQGGAEDPEEQSPTVQDTEIHLLKSGELTQSVSLGFEEMAQFGDGSRELFVKSSCYSVIAMEVGKAGPTISWVFSSEPKSISFSVVYREGELCPLEQAKVLIPLTRCQSHKESIQGQLKARSPGTYLLIFDNSFSRFISKKVLYHLTVEKPVIYDGSDCP
ncbi:hypothetical protein GJAV_G00085020 [Gymnothorax javanicus]|nr:hypothetical protein GJAV_G00085020 [Gymnothorax javanicus]